jgi:hypothetical protein
MARTVIRVGIAAAAVALVAVACGKATTGTCEESNNCAESENDASGSDSTSPVFDDSGGADGGDASVQPVDDGGLDAVVGVDTTYDFPEVSIDAPVPDGCATEVPAANAVYVTTAPGGNTSSSCGTTAVPCSTIQAGINSAQINGATDVYVAINANTSGPVPYVEALTIAAPVAIHGGWRQVGDTWTRDCTGNAPTQTIVQAPAGAGVTVTVQSGVQASIETVTIESIDEPTYGQSLYGVMAASGANLTLTNVIIEVAGAGPGTNGGAGSNTTTPVACTSAGNGQPGAAQAPGSAGTAGTYTASGYQLGATGSTGPTGNPGGNGGAGQLGSSETCEHCTENPPVCCNPTCQIMHPGQALDPASCTPASCSADTSTTSGTGGTGNPGCGGQGGGGGGGGTGGGSSIGIYAWGATVNIVGGEISVGPGGTGGAGGSGGSGAAGVAGAVGTPACTGSACSANTCKASTTGPGGGQGGTPGGTGGTGGTGGGGAGGDSYGYYVQVVGDAGSVSASGATIQVPSTPASGGGPNGPNGHTGDHN